MPKRAKPKRGEVFVLKMPLVRLKDLFDAMIEVLAPKYGYKSSAIKTKIIGIRPGEKLIELLLNEYEMEVVHETKKFFIITPLKNKKLIRKVIRIESVQKYFSNIKL